MTTDDKPKPGAIRVLFKLFMYFMLAMIVIVVIAGVLGKSDKELTPSTVADIPTSAPATETSTAAPATMETAPEPVETKQWYETGTLHTGTLADWKNGTSDDRLATSARVVMVVGKYDTPPDDLRKRAEEMEQCISEVAGGDGLDEMKVAEIGASCALLMGYGQQ